MPSDTHFPVHFFTIVLNGEPFIRYHIEQFKKLPFTWHWHVVEGLAELKHDTAWSVRNGATLPEEVVKDGRSTDGTAEYLDELAREFPDNVTIYRAPNGRHWDGKLEMINAPMAALEKAGVDCLLWEIDSDELWTDQQMILLRDLFLKNPARFAAVFYCWYFVGPNLAINRRRPYPEIEWRRAWRYQPGMKWFAHEPPVLGAPIPGSTQLQDVATKNPFTPREMEAQNLVFHHFAYVTEAQLEFKEKYYGYKDITAQWKRLQELSEFPAKLKDYFNWPWVHPGALVEPSENCGIKPLATLVNEKWVFPVPEAPMAAPTAGQSNAKRGILYVKWGPKSDVMDRSIQSVRAEHPELPIHVHQLPDTSTLLDKAALFDVSPFEETLFLDVDTMVLGRLDFGFEMAVRHGLACCICENPWARRYGGIKNLDLVEYNTGVLFFTKAAKPIFDGWKKYVRAVDSSILFYNSENKLVKMPYNDQAGFSLAVAEAEKPPFILPFNWNFRPAWHRAWWGPIKVWHDYSAPPPDVVKFSQEQSRPDAVIRFVRFN